jgi:hypothetical protein
VPGPDRDELLQSLRSLPRQLLLALINGTAILVIVAAILALVATSRVMHLSEKVASTMTDAVLSRIDVEPQQVRARINGVGEDVRALAETLKQAKAEGKIRPDPDIQRLTERVGALQASIDRLGDARSNLVDDAIARAAREVAEGFKNLRPCGKALPSPAAAAPPTPKTLQALFTPLNRSRHAPDRQEF